MSGYGVDVDHQVGEVRLHYVEHGEGAPLVALHGAGVDHRDIEVAIEGAIPTRGYRRIYPDLPGMGRSTSQGLSCNDDVVTVLVDFIENVGAGPVLLWDIRMAVTWLEAWPRADQTSSSGWPCCVRPLSSHTTSPSSR